MPKNTSIFKSLFGRFSAEARPSHPNYKLVNDCPLFDRDWYQQQYPDVVEAKFDPALHYLLQGAKDGRDPGPGFSTRLYLQEHVDVSLSDLNPLVHYILHGQKEHRKIFASGAKTRPPGKSEQPDNYTDPLSWPLATDEDIQWVRQEGLVCTSEYNLLQFSGTSLGKVPPAMLEEETQCALSSCIKSLVTYSKLLDARKINDIQMYRGNTRIDISGLIVKSVSEPLTRTPFLEKTEAQFRLADVWFKNEYDLSMRFDSAGVSGKGCSVLRFYQSNPSNDHLQIQAECLLSSNEINFVDAGLLNPYYPVLITNSDPEGELKSVSILPFPSLCRGGAHYGELCAVWTDKDYMENLQKVSADLLLGMLQVEVDTPDFSLAKINTNLRGALGSERIFHRDLQIWLTRVMRIRVAAVTTTKVTNIHAHAYLKDALENTYDGATSNQIDLIDKRQKHGVAELTLPPDAIPSLHALVSRKINFSTEGPVIIGSFVICEQTSLEPKWQITLPQSGRDLLDVQPRPATIAYPLITGIAGKGRGRVDTNVTALLPSAIRFCNTTMHDDASLLMPVAPEIPAPLLQTDTHKTQKGQSSITVIVDLTNGMNPGCFALLQSLRQQTTIHALNIIAIINAVVTENEQDIGSRLQAYFPGEIILAARESNIAVGSVDVAIRRSAGDYLLFVDQGVILHDPRTLDVLCQMAGKEGVASTSCMLISDPPMDSPHKVHYYSGGMLISHPGDPAGCYSKIKTSTALPLLTYPVLANSTLLQMSAKATWLELNQLGVADQIIDHFNLTHGIRAVEKGFVNYCTTAVSAIVQASTIDNTSRSADNGDLPGTDLPFDIYAMPVTIVREFQP